MRYTDKYLSKSNVLNVDFIVWFTKMNIIYDDHNPFN